MKLPAIIDIEASGFGKNSYPIEIGIAMPNGQRHCFLIRPEADWQHWDEGAEQLHGITRKMLQQHGHAAWDIASELNDLLAGEKVYSDAWGNDMSWLARLFDAAQLPQLFRIDTIIALLDESQMENWTLEKERQFSHIALQRHRASSDAEAIQKTYSALVGIEVEGRAGFSEFELEAAGRTFEIAAAL